MQCVNRNWEGEIKQQGDKVYLLKPNDVLLGYNIFSPYEKIYGACVFAENNSIAKELEKIGVSIGGSGTGKADQLPDHIEHIVPDYSLYGITDTAYGFLTRGCPRCCPFCIVANKEGKESRKVADLKEFWNGQKYIELMDPNTLACKDWKNILQQLIDSKSYVDFNQGVDIRLLTAEKLEYLRQIKIKHIHFAWDNYNDKKMIVPKFEELKKATGWNRGKVSWFT